MAHEAIFGRLDRQLVDQAAKDELAIVKGEFERALASRGDLAVLGQWNRMWTAYKRDYVVAVDEPKRNAVIKESHLRISQIRTAFNDLKRALPDDKGRGIKRDVADFEAGLEKLFQAVKTKQLLTVQGVADALGQAVADTYEDVFRQHARMDGDRLEKKINDIKDASARVAQCVREFIAGANAPPEFEELERMLDDGGRGKVRARNDDRGNRFDRDRRDDDERRRGRGGDYRDDRWDNDAGPSRREHRRQRLDDNDDDVSVVRGIELAVRQLRRIAGNRHTVDDTASREINAECSRLEALADRLRDMQDM